MPEPYACFKKFFDDKMFQLMANQSIIYADQVRSSLVFIDIDNCTLSV